MAGLFSESDRSVGLSASLDYDFNAAGEARSSRPVVRLCFGTAELAVVPVSPKRCKEIGAVDAALSRYEERAIVEEAVAPVLRRLLRLALPSP